jgi:iron complex outermembrane receptor protein
MDSVKTWVAIVALQAIAPLTLHAQGAAGAKDTNTLEEVVVTAERRSSDLQDVALAVTVIGGDTIAKLGSADIGQILQLVPSLVMQNVSGGNSTQSVQGSGAPPNITIRGLGTDGPNRAGAVAVYQDGVLMQGGGGNSYDMQRVEVLRGPQGTLYGRGATAGAVNFITNNPGKEFAASGRLQAGSYGLLGLQGVLNVPFSSSFAARAAFNHVRHDGYFNNGQSDEDSTSARVKLAFTPNDQFSLILTGISFRSNANSPGIVDVTVDPTARDWRSALQGGTKSPNRYKKLGAEVQWDLGVGALTYLAGYQTASSYFTSFCSCFFGMTGQGTYVAVDSPLNQTTTQELRFASTGKSAFTWVAGAYHYHNKLQQEFRLSTAPPAIGAVDTPFTTNLQHYSPSSLGLFGELTFAANDSTRFTVGVRNTRDHIVQDQCSNCTPATLATASLFVDATNTHFDWKARVEHDFSPDHLLYGIASTGYRPGAVVQGLLSDIETVRAYEIGSKNTFGGRYTVNGAGYYYKYGGFQNVLTQPVTVSGVTSLVTTVIPIPATFYGVEIEATLQFDENNKFTITPAYQSAKFTDSCTTCVVGMGQTIGQPLPLLTKGKDVPRTPHFSVSASYEHIFRLGSGNLSWLLDAHQQSSATTDFDLTNYPTANPAYLQGNYTVANTSLSYDATDAKYSVTLYGRNITNQIYKTALGNSNPAGSPPGFAFYVNDPRIFGVMLSTRL